MSNCSHCGVVVPPTASRCPECGAPITGGPRRDLPVHSTPVAEPAPKPGRSAGCALFLGLAIGVLVIGGLTGVVALLLRSPSEAPVAAPAVEVPVPVAVPASTSAPVPAGGGGFAAIKARGTLRVAADPDAPPFLARTADGYEGYEYGIMTAIAAEIGVPVTVVATPFEGLDDALRAGVADLAVGQVSPATRWDGVSYSVSYLQYSLCLVVPKGSKIQHLPQLLGKRVGTWDDPAATSVLAVGVGGAYTQTAYNADGYFEALEAGKLDAVVYDCPLARHELAAHPRLVVADDAINVATYSVVVPAADPTLLADTNRVLQKLGDQGLLASIEQRWLGAASTATATATGRVVVVQRGDTLASIAARELGDAGKAAELHDKNRDLLGNDPNALYAGLRLRIGP